MGTPHADTEGIALPPVKSVERIEVRPGDRFVITFEHVTHISEYEAETVKAKAGAVLGVGPDRILLLASASLTVLNPDGDPR